MMHGTSRYAGQDGFSLVELLIAMTICVVISAGIAAVVPPARVAFEHVPAELDLQQRGRTAADSIAQAIRAAGSTVIVSEELGALAGMVPAVIPFDLDLSGTRFLRLKVIAPRPNAAQGILAQHQAGPHGDLVLSPSRCPGVPVVCGFTNHTTAVIADGSGRFDVFTIASALAATETLTPARQLVPPYAAGSIVVEVDVYTLQLDPQPDGTHALVRVTAAGAVQPIADRVTTLHVEPFTLDGEGELIPIPIQDLSDGPWWSVGPDGDYDDDVFRIRRLQIALTMQAAYPVNAQRTFRFAVVLRNVP
jgi:prepilin-type N-terminal cleavage/methylation domain-containing protein